MTLIAAAQLTEQRASLLVLAIGGIVGGITLATLGWNALKGGRPVVLRTRWLVPAILVALLVEPLGQAAGHLFEEYRQRGLAGMDPGGLLVLIAILGVSIWMARRAFAGWTVFGTDLDTVRRAVVATLRGLGHVYVVKVNRFQIPKSGAELTLVEGKRLGTVGLRMARRRDDSLLGEILGGVRTCLASEFVALSSVQCRRWIFAGLAMAICALVLCLALWAGGA